MTQSKAKRLRGSIHESFYKSKPKILILRKGFACLPFLPKRKAGAWGGVFAVDFGGFVGVRYGRFECFASYLLCPLFYFVH